MKRKNPPAAHGAGRRVCAVVSKASVDFFAHLKYAEERYIKNGTMKKTSKIK